MGASVGYLPAARGLPRSSGGSASTISLSRPAQASRALRPAGLLSRPKATFVTRLRSGQLPSRTACQLPELPTSLRMDSSSTGVLGEASESHRCDGATSSQGLARRHGRLRRRRSKYRCRRSDSYYPVAYTGARKLSGVSPGTCGNRLSRGEECWDRVLLGGPSRTRKIRSALPLAKGYPALRLLAISAAPDKRSPGGCDCRATTG